MTGYHTRWVRRELDVDDPERIAIRKAKAFGKALYDCRIDLGLSTDELAQRADLNQDEIECIEEGGTEPTLALLWRLAAALNAEVRLTCRHDLCSVRFEVRGSSAFTVRTGLSDGDDDGAPHGVPQSRRRLRGEVP